MKVSKKEILAQGKSTLSQEGIALQQLSDDLGDSFVECVELLLNVKGRVVVTGMGKSGHIGRKIAATLSSTGTPAFFVHPAEASHGDLGMMTSRDALLAISNSGNTAELSDILLYADSNHLPVVAITANPSSPLGLHSTICLTIPHKHEACPLDCAPTISTTMSLGLGDALAMALMYARGFTPEDFKSFHPGGSLGHKLLKVKDVMHTGDEIPLVDINSSMRDVIVELSGKCLGCVGISKDGHLVGIITDGDLRRSMDKDILDKQPSQIMTPNPKFITKESRVVDAAQEMHEKKITSMFVVDKDKTVGILHIHDCK